MQEEIEDISNHISEHIFERVSERIAELVSERVSKRLAERFAESSMEHDDIDRVLGTRRGSGCPGGSTHGAQLHRRPRPRATELVGHTGR